MWFKTGDGPVAVEAVAGEADGAQFAGCELRGHGPAGQDGDAHAGFNQFEDRFGQHDFTDAARDYARGIEEFQQHRTFFQGRIDDEVFVREILRVDEWFRGPWMVRRDEHDHFVAGQGRVFDFAVAHRVAGDGQVEFAVEERFEGMRSGFDDQLDVHGGIFFLEDFQARREPVVHGVALRAQADEAALGGSAALDFFFGAVEFVEDAAGGAQQAFAGGGEHHFAAAALEQRAAEQLFGVAELMAERGLCEMQARGGAGDARFLGDGGDDFQVAHFQTHRASPAQVV